ncbi:penicillin-binding protein 1A [Litorimonas taeanensis]|uniref:Penicillin-binding protein 1A n=1 Tax=Litorimonas taeanensis TaxID=568099 RepID=A0A420WJR2_9PROT|nr:transglycosylase domain-containing protein [Litorimonas taeanensis]RKQ71263.1 penicillin-binding protein 1A [Litorimonas taeanensis]
MTSPEDISVERSQKQPLSKNKKAINWRKIWRISKWLLGIGFVLGIIFAVFAFVYVIRATKDLPTLEVLKEYKPPVMSRVHAGDGKLISEFRTEARVFVPIESVPLKLQHAFVAAEDQRFYKHNGFDEKGFARAMVANIGHVINGRRLEGGSTLTQQVAKNFLVGDQRHIDRKIREVVIAGRIEKAMSKDQILELYLNDIYFGRAAYGVAAASLNYFGKPMKDLTLEEMAYLAVLPKAPSNYQTSDPRKKERAINRRAYVINRMVEDGYAEEAEGEAAKATDIIVTDRLEGEEYLAAEYFVEEARKQISSLYGYEELYSGGLSIRTTLDTKMQLNGRRSLRRGLEMLDRRHGYRGPLTSWDSLDDWKKRLADYEGPKDIDTWRIAIVLKAEKSQAELGFAPAEVSETVAEGEEIPEEITTEDTRGILKLEDIQWAGKALPKGAVGDNPRSVKDVLSVGDIILVQRKSETEKNVEGNLYNLRQIPKANGGLIAMDPHTGRVLALVGGYSFEQSQFNRVTQAARQPGSAFKPFVYAAALQNGFTPSSQVLDAPFVIERQDVECEENALGALELRGAGENRQEDESLEDVVEEDECERFYKPSNYNAGKFYGLSTLRLGIEKSRNAMTVRLANEIGMAPIMNLSERFGIYDEAKPELAWALGAGETTLIRLATAYSEMINGGKAVEPSILDRVQDGQGNTIFVNGDVVCETCQQEEYMGGPPPELPDLREQVIDPVTAYQVTYMMQGVVENGTGGAIRSLGRPLGGKTGTTNDSIDTWFMGFSPDLVVGVYIGVDTPEQMGFETGSSAAVPVFKDFMAEALEGTSPVPFRIPEGVTLAPVNRDTGETSYIGAPNFILEAFKPGTEPSIGGLSSSIRVGSGSDTLSAYQYDTGDFNRASEEETAGRNGGEALSDIEGVESNTDSDISANSEPEAPRRGAVSSDSPVQPPVNKEPEVDDIDDGLY